VTDASNSNNLIIHPKIKEFTNNLALLLARDEREWLEGNGQQKLEKVLLASDDLLEPNGNFILVDTTKSLRELFQLN
jgi:hypothetical protein